MWEWIKSLFAKKALVPPARPADVPAREDLFDPDERLIYTYVKGVDPSGAKVYVRRDPIELWRRVMEHGAELSISSKVAASASKAAPARWDQMVARLREVFDVPPVSEGGLSGVHMVRLLNHFMTYCSSVKKNLPTATTSASETSAGTSGSGPPTGADPQGTKITSGSGSTESGTCSDVPTPSGSASGSPPAG